MKFLVIRFSSIGDIVLTTPVIRCLKTQIDTAEVHFLTKKSFVGMMEANPYIDKTIALEENITDLINQLRQEDYDYIIDLHHNIRTLKIKKALKKKSFSFNKLNFQKWLYTNLKINKMPKVHILDRYLETVQEFGVKNDGKGLDYFIPENKGIDIGKDLPLSHQAGYIGIVIGATYFTKRYPLENLKELCKDINHPIVLLGGKEDAAMGEAIASIDTYKIYNACGKFSLHESADLVRHAKIIVSNDTGLMHIAAAFNKPIISLWGNTTPDLGMYPYYGTQRSAAYALANKLEVHGLSCRPCSKIGYKKCPRGHFKCMKNITPISVLDKINQLL